MLFGSADRLAQARHKVRIRISLRMGTSLELLIAMIDDSGRGSCCGNVTGNGGLGIGGFEADLRRI